MRRRLVALTCSAVVSVAGVSGASAATAAGNGTGTGVGTGTAVLTGPDGHPALKVSQLPKGAFRYAGPGLGLGATGTTFPSRTGAANAPAPSGSNAPLIINGTTVQSSDYPGVVGIVTTFWAQDSTGAWGQWADTCTGTVVSATKILTTGLCATGYFLANTVVVAGRSMLSDTSSGFVAQVSQVWTDPKFNANALNHGATVPTHDVSVLTLATPLPAAYVPVKLTAAGDQSPYSRTQPATAVGYGLVRKTDPAYTLGYLRQATLNIVADSGCLVVMTPAFDTNTMACIDGQDTPPEGNTMTCWGDFGGPLFLNGVEIAIADQFEPNYTCGQVWGYGVDQRVSAYRAQIDAAAALPDLANDSFTGSGHADILAVDNGGNLMLYPGSGVLNDGLGGFAGSARIGTGWGGFGQVFMVDNWHGDHTPSIMAVGSNGYLYEYRTDGHGTFTNGSGTVIGTGWNAFTKVYIVANWTGDGTEDLIGLMPNGTLREYESDGKGGWINPYGIQIGTNWNAFSQVISVGDWKGDGHDTLLAIKPNGNLYMYESDTKGGWINPMGTQIGTGWTAFKSIFTPGSWSGDGTMDIIGITPGGVMDLYQTDGHGNWLTGQGIRIGNGWTFRQIF